MARLLLDVLLAAPSVVLAVLLWRHRAKPRSHAVIAAAPEPDRTARDERDQFQQRVGWLEQALALVHDGVVICDATGATVFAHDPDAIVERRPQARVIKDLAVREMLAIALDGDATTREVELAGPPRQTLVLHAVPITSASGGVVGAVARIDDVSERRRVDAVRRDFVSNISHELRTPVGALSLLAETLHEERSPSTMRRLAARVESEAHRLAAIIEDLLTLSRIEAQHQQPYEAVPIERIVREAVDRVRAAATQNSIAVVVAPFEAAIAVEGDRLQLVSALANLLDNAVKYSDEGGTVSVRTSLDSGGGEPVVTIAVVDNGMGIPMRDRDRIFERFYRVDRDRARDTGGTGLGLAIVRHVMANHRGTVTLESLEGEGSTFTIRLPHLAPRIEAPAGSSSGSPIESASTAS